MPRIVSVEFFQQEIEGPGLFAASPAMSAELVAPSNDDWVRTYRYPRGLLAVGESLASLGKKARPLTTGVAKLARGVKASAYECLVRTLEAAGSIPTGKKQFGLIGETLSDFKVRHVQKRNALAIQLKSCQPGLQRAEIVSDIGELSRVLERVAVIQNARKGW